MLLPVNVLVVVELSEATVPVPRDYVEPVGVNSVWGEELLEVVKPGSCLSLSRGIDRGDSEIFVSNLDV